MTNILEILEQAPALMASQSVKVTELEKEHRTIKARLSASRNYFTIKHKDEKNATLTAAFVENEEEVKSLVVQEIQKDAEVKIAKIRFEEIENQWISARKLGGMNQSELDAIRGSTILDRSDSRP